MYTNARVSCLELLKRVWCIVGFDKVYPPVSYRSDILIVYFLR
jgi:hypothetical protein